MAPRRINVKEPKWYYGIHNYELLDNFCWHVEKYVVQMSGSLDEDKVNDVLMFLVIIVNI